MSEVPLKLMAVRWQTLGKLAWGNAEHQNSIAAEGGIEAIVAGMKVQPLNPGMKLANSSTANLKPET